MESLIDLISQHWLYLIAGACLVILLAILWLWLQRPTKEEIDHQRRFEELKEKSKDTYRRLRPLK